MAAFRSAASSCRSWQAPETRLEIYVRHHLPCRLVWVSESKVFPPSDLIHTIKVFDDKEDRAYIPHRIHIIHDCFIKAQIKDIFPRRIFRVMNDIPFLSVEEIIEGITSWVWRRFFGRWWNRDEVRKDCDLTPAWRRRRALLPSAGECSTLATTKYRINPMNVVGDKECWHNDA